MLYRLYLSVLEYLVKGQERRVRKEVGGILVFWCVYKPEQEGKNVIFHFHPDIAHIEGEVREQLKKAADLIRESGLK